eukprot:g29910.t1
MLSLLPTTRIHLCHPDSSLLTTPANVTNALDVIYSATNTLFIVAGDFNQANLRRVLPKYHDHISCLTMGPNILDHCYTTIKDAYPENVDEYAITVMDFISKCVEDCTPKESDFNNHEACHGPHQLQSRLDPLQFAYRHNRSTENATSLTLHSSLEHLDNKDTYVRLLFADYSSAFKTGLKT